MGGLYGGLAAQREAGLAVLVTLKPLTIIMPDMGSVMGRGPRRPRYRIITSLKSFRLRKLLD